MESVHSVDVSWMTHASNKSQKDPSPRPLVSYGDSPSNQDMPSKTAQAGNSSQAKDPVPAVPKPTFSRPGFSKNISSERTALLNGSAPKSVTPSLSTTRRNSWLSNLSSKFSSSPGSNGANNSAAASPISNTSTAQESLVPRPLGPSAPRNAVLQHGVKVEGDAPYTPAPPKSGQSNFLQSAFRRLSTSGGQLSTTGKGVQHGLCERKVLNIDHHRERCDIAELYQPKLRRVAFCVDVEIASGPRYTEDIGDDKKKERKERKRLTERGEGDALKNPDLKIQEEEEAAAKPAVEEISKDPEPEVPETTSETSTEAKDGSTAGEKDTTKKKEKKKRSEEERKARKEKKRKLAEESGILPVELLRNGSDTSLESTSPGTPTTKPYAFPTIDPVRIYRRCCQLRETPILKKITEQLTASATNMEQSGVVRKLDLTGYWLQQADLVTLGDYLAVVPVKEVILENCGLNDETLRVILAGLLAAKLPEPPGAKKTKTKDGEVVQGGVVERVVIKDNVKIGRDGWRHICLFINMCRSLKSMDLSKIPFPQPLAPAPSATPNRAASTSSATSDMSSLLEKAIGKRLGGAELELLNLAECGLTTCQLGGIINGVINSGLRRLGIAGNGINAEGMGHVVRYIKEGKCEGLDLGGNDLKDLLGPVAEALDENNNIYALSLAACNLTPDSLWALFPALAKLKNFRFIDLSQNHDLFEKEPSALSLLRRYLPKMKMLRRIHLADVALTPDQAIALAEILPESPSLAHVTLLENPQLAALADAKDEASQEEACALYTSLMVAVRVSKTIICIDIEVPSNESSEIVKALAKQVVAYSLWNLERGTDAAAISGGDPVVPESPTGEKDVAVPDVLLHLVGHVEGFHENHDDDEPAPDEDYVIGGTGVVKALSICLRNKANDSRSRSGERVVSDTSEGGSGTATPKGPVRGGKAKDMSKNLLGSARKIRARLQPALVKESKAGVRSSYSRLLFLDQTLEGMIKRFEDEFPETRLPQDASNGTQISPSEVDDGLSRSDTQGSETEQGLSEALLSDDDDGVMPVLSRHNSDVSLASKALSQEEGRMHRFGQKLRRDILKPEMEDHEHGTTGEETEQGHLQLLRAMVEEMDGDEVKKQIELNGQDTVMAELGDAAIILRHKLMDGDPEAWDKFVESQKAAARNSGVAAIKANSSATE